jgi:adenylylsulfate kinase
VSGVVVWLTGLPQSGKSTLAARARERLVAAERCVCVLDGDAVRAAMVPPPGYGDDARAGFYATLGRLAALLAAQGLIVLVPATAPRRAYREAARAAAPAFVEVHVAADVAQCAARDIKGLYAAARDRRLGGLPGVDAAYEPPVSPALVADGGFDPHAPDRIAELVAACVPAPAHTERGAAAG